MSPVLRLRFRHAAGTAPIDVSGEVATLNEAFKTANVTFQAGASAPLDEPAMTHVNVLSCRNTDLLTSDQKSLFAHAGVGPPCLFIVEAMSKGQGCARHPPNVLGAVVRRSHQQWLPAHEVGHLFGLEHIVDAARLMHIFPDKINTNPPELIDEELSQIAKFFANLPVGLSFDAVESGTPVIPASKWVPFLDVRADAIDLRDRAYQPRLQALPPRQDPEAYLRVGVPVLNQGDDGACTGYALATVIHYLLRTRPDSPDRASVSPRMLFDLARRYDEWADDSLPGASPRATLKGWARHGVCTDELWNAQEADTRLQNRIAADAATRPLGAYFRIAQDDLTAMHSALRDVGVLFASCAIHRGWRRVNKRTGVIPVDKRALGHHAVAIVGYDERGFWIQNSWGERWGRGGLALLPYDDWLAHGLDVWAAQLGVRIETGSARSQSPEAESCFESSIVTTVALDERGRLRRRGHFAADQELLASSVRRATAAASDERPTQLLLHLPCGEPDEREVANECAWMARSAGAAGMTPLSILWTSGIATRLRNVVREELERRGLSNAGVPAALASHQRWDDSLEGLARRDGARFWASLKARATAAVRDPSGGARAIGGEIASLLREQPQAALHVSCHCTGAIPALQLVQWLTTIGEIADGPLKGLRGLGLRISSLTLWRPACSIHLFDRIVVPAVESGTVARVILFTPDEERRPLVPALYSRSLLHLASAALERVPRRPRSLFGGLEDPGVPLLGLASHVRRDNRLRLWFKKRGRTFQLVRSDDVTDATASSVEGVDDLIARTFGTISREAHRWRRRS